jgi:hypothetical protein
MPRSSAARVFGPGKLSSTICTLNEIAVKVCHKTDSEESRIQNIFQIAVYTELLQLAKAEIKSHGIEDWKSISMQTLSNAGATANFRIDRSIGGQPAMAYNLVIDSMDGSVTNWRRFADRSPGSCARSNKTVEENASRNKTSALWAPANARSRQSAGRPGVHYPA